MSIAFTKHLLCNECLPCILSGVYLTYHEALSLYFGRDFTLSHLILCQAQQVNSNLVKISLVSSYEMETKAKIFWTGNEV